MPTRRRAYVIAQFSDVHCGDPRFEEQLMLRLVREVNEARPDLVIVPGDLTADGYDEQFHEFTRFLDLIDCPQRVVIAGNHDCRNVGDLLFERIVGPRNLTATFDFPPDGDRSLVVVAVDSNIPDLNDGEVGREKMRLAERDLAGDAGFRIFVLHHHLVSIPGTGRERNIVWDAGDVLHSLRDAGVDLVLAGHKHVPYIWPVGDTLIVTSGTGASRRTRGDAPPSYNLLEIDGRSIEVTVRSLADGVAVKQRLPRRAGEARTARAR